MKKFVKLCVVAVALFAIAYFAPAIPNLVYNLCAKFRFDAGSQDQPIEYLEQPAAHIAGEKSEPALLPDLDLDWHLKSVDQWLAERDQHDINFTLSREKSLDQKWLSPE